METDEGSLEIELKALADVAQSLEMSTDGTVKIDVQKISASIKGAIYMLIEEFDTDYANDSLKTIKDQLETIKRTINAQSEFHNKMKQLAMRYRSTKEIKDTLTYRTAIRLLKDAVGNDRANEEIDKFFQVHFVKK